jgi:hypothetical protein
MKTTTFFTMAIIALFCTACNNSSSTNKTEKTKTEVPEPLNDGSIDNISINKRRGESLMNELYTDLVKKDPQLKKLEDQLAHFNEGISDSLAKFNSYNAKSNEYYGSANQSLADISDTVLRAEVASVLAGSKAKYMDKVSKFITLNAHIDSNKIKIADYYAVLKVAASLDVIEQYQDKQMPDITSTANAANDAQKLRARVTILARKYLKK